MAKEEVQQKITLEEAIEKARSLDLPMRTAYFRGFLTDPRIFPEFAQSIEAIREAIRQKFSQTEIEDMLVMSILEGARHREDLRDPEINIRQVKVEYDLQMMDGNECTTYQAETVWP